MKYKIHFHAMTKNMLSPLWIYFLACSIFMYISLILFTHQVGAATNLIKDTAILLTESMLLMSPALLMGKRWRWIACVIAVLCNFFLLANINYSRYWHDLIPFSSIFNKSSYNTIVLKSSITYLRWSDIIFVINSILPIILYKVLKISRSAGFASIKKVSIGVSILVLYITVQVLSINSIKSYHIAVGTKDFTFKEALRCRQNIQFSRKNMWRGTGFILYTKYQFSLLDSVKSITLTPSDIARINKFLNNQHSNYARQFECNGGKNLIIIIVESLNADVIGKKTNGKEITPNLNRLITEEGTIYNLNIVTQVRDGGSSDGQMMYNTGLLPIKAGPTVYAFGNNTFPSLVSALKPAASIEIISEQGFVWNHFITSKQYGYDHLYDRVGEVESGQHPGADALLFKKALQVSKNLESPFLMEITTISMHTPFIDPNADIDKNFDNLDGMPMQLANYYRITNYFDRQLGLFIEGLKENGLYNKSVIVIASDHNIAIYGNGDDYKKILFMAINSGKSEKINRTAGQIDVFPTILDIMGVYDSAWRGLGMSMLDHENNSAADAYGTMHGKSSGKIEMHQREAWDISDLIIRSNYFSEKK